MKLSVVSQTINQTNLVTIHEIVVAREYYWFIKPDTTIRNKISTLLLGGKGYTRYVEDEELLNNIRIADRNKVMDL